MLIIFWGWNRYFLSKYLHKLIVFTGDAVVKNMPANEGNSRGMGLISLLGRAPGEGNGYSLQCSCLDNSVDTGAGGSQSVGVAKSWT